ncbi:hypothetical protein [Aeoliella straminimaris]|nr:hypothetical protein [Aeoliella straminimaris]
MKQLVASVTVLVSVLSTASAQTTLYWDINGSTPGAGQVDGFTDGNWGLDNFWSTDPNGAVATGPWTDGANAVFSAGDDAVDHFININGAQTANSVTLEDGLVTIASGSMDVGTGDIIVEDGATLKFENREILNDGARVLLRNGTIVHDFMGNYFGMFRSGTELAIDGTGTVNRTNALVTYSSGSVITGIGGTPENGGAGTFIKEGPGEFRYQGSGLPLTSYAKLVVNEGLFRLGFANDTQDARGFGADPLSLDTEGILLDGGAIGTSLFLAEAQIHENRGITIGPNGGTFNMTAGHFGINGPVTAAPGTTLTIIGGGGDVEFKSTMNLTTFQGDIVQDGGDLMVVESLSTPNHSGAGGRVGISEGKEFTVGASNSDQTYSGSIIGTGTFVKVGTGTQTLSGDATTTTATLEVQEGTLSLTDLILAETANVSLLNSGGTLDLSFAGTNTIASLFIDDAAQALGTWGAIGSGAQNESSLITGSGLLDVTVPGVDVLIGDYNQDGTVDIADYTVWRNNLGGDGSVLMNRDPANTGAVDASDYASWKSNFGESTAAAATSVAVSVPEPGTALIALISIALLGGRQVLRKCE